MEYKGEMNQLRFNFPILNCKVGSTYEMVITFEVTEMTRTATTVEILDLVPKKKEQPQIVPSPS